MLRYIAKIFEILLFLVFLVGCNTVFLTPTNVPEITPEVTIEVTIEPSPIDIFDPTPTPEISCIWGSFYVPEQGVDLYKEPSMYTLYGIADGFTDLYFVYPLPDDTVSSILFRVGKSDDIYVYVASFRLKECRDG